MMSDKELKEAKEIIESVCQETDLVCEIQESAKKLFVHIDEQAEQIAKLTKEADCTEIYEALESAGIDMGDNEQPQDIVTAIEILGSRIVRWQKIAQDKTAQIGWHTSCNCGRLQDTLKWAYCDWTREIPQSVRDGWNDWAAKELGL